MMHLFYLCKREFSKAGKNSRPRKIEASLSCTIFSNSAKGKERYFFAWKVIIKEEIIYSFYKMEKVLVHSDSRQQVHHMLIPSNKRQNGPKIGDQYGRNLDIHKFAQWL